MTRYGYAPSRFKPGASTGARISSSGYRITSPRGGFYQSGYETARQVASWYGYDPEEFVKVQISKKYHHRNWDFYKKEILGRKHYNHSATFPWLPRFRKKLYKTNYNQFQEGHKSFTSKLRKRKLQYFLSPGKGQYFKQTGKQYRRRCTCRCHTKVHRSPVLYSKSRKCSHFY